MNPEELSIGDWVKVLNYHWDGRPYTGQVDGIMKKHGTYYLQFGSALSVEIDRCEPIPITPEILEKNGFESAENIFGLKTYKLNDDFVLEDRGEEKCLCRSCYKMQPSSTFWVCNIEYVHQLQHVLKLCGINKTIEP